MFDNQTAPTSAGKLKKKMAHTVMKNCVLFCSLKQVNVLWELGGLLALRIMKLQAWILS
jgi:hypothetical protein